MTTTVYLVRHGNSTGNVNKLVIGTTDVPLTEEGLKQGEMVAEFFRDKQVDAVYSSPLARAAKTAEFTAKLKNVPLTTDERFAEFNFGDIYEGLSWEEAKKTEDGVYLKYKDPYEFTNVKFPCGGESCHEVVDRFLQGLADLEKNHAGEKVVLVTHSIALMLFLVYVKNGFTLKGAKRENRLPNASITTLEIENGKITIIEEGFTGHLDGITV